MTISDVKKIPAILCHWIIISSICLAVIFSMLIMSSRIDRLQISIEKLAVLTERNKQDLLDAISVLGGEGVRHGK